MRVLPFGKTVIGLAREVGIECQRKNTVNCQDVAFKDLIKVIIQTAVHADLFEDPEGTIQLVIELIKNHVGRLWYFRSF